MNRCVVFCILFSLSLFGKPAAGQSVFDKDGLLSAEQSSQLNRLCSEVNKSANVKVLVFVTLDQRLKTRAAKKFNLAREVAQKIHEGRYGKGNSIVIVLSKWKDKKDDFPSIAFDYNPGENLSLRLEKLQPNFSIKLDEALNVNGDSNPQDLLFLMLKQVVSAIGNALTAAPTPTAKAAGVSFFDLA